MTVCPSCSGISGSVLACNDMCENVMMGCLAQHAALDADWNHFVGEASKKFFFFLNLKFLCIMYNL